MNEQPDCTDFPRPDEGRFSLRPRTIDLRELGIDKEQAADLRWRLRAFAEDWQRPEMDVYDVD
jgi:hypothetical protein